MKKLIILLVVCFSTQSWSQSRPYRSMSPSTKPKFTYDLGLSSGNYNGKSYTEIQLGVNWFLQDYLIWRNAAFNRFGADQESTLGLDTSARLNYNSPRAADEWGFGVFAGPGLRISKKEYTGVFGEAGASLKGPGASLGVQVKTIQYPSPAEGQPKTDTVVALVIAAGGAF